MSMFGPGSSIRSGIARLLPGNYPRTCAKILNTLIATATSQDRLVVTLHRRKCQDDAPACFPMIESVDNVLYLFIIMLSDAIPTPSIIFQTQFDRQAKTSRKP